MKNTRNDNGFDNGNDKERTIFTRYTHTLTHTHTRSQTHLDQTRKSLLSLLELWIFKIAHYCTMSVKKKKKKKKKKGSLFWTPLSSSKKKKKEKKKFLDEITIL